MTEKIPDNITPCGITSEGHGGSCISRAGQKAILDTLKVQSMEGAKEKTNCASDKCTLNVVSRMPNVDKLILRESKIAFKIDGPTDSGLLNNYQIDGLLSQFNAKYPEFFAYNFNMRNYADYHFKDGYTQEGPDTLATILAIDLFDGSFDGTKYKMAGCVINTDVYQGAGKHWMSIFVDMRTQPITIEFFNSSGNAPQPEYVNWIEKTKQQFEMSGKKATTIRVSSFRHQESRSECGVYSVFYIWCRILGVPYSRFADPRTKIADKYMFEFRQHLFNTDLKVFDWDEYSKRVKIEWEL